MRRYSKYLLPAQMQRYENIKHVLASRKQRDVAVMIKSPNDWGWRVEKILIPVVVPLTLLIIGQLYNNSQARIQSEQAVMNLIGSLTVLLDSSDLKTRNQAVSVLEQIASDPAIDRRSKEISERLSTTYKNANRDQIAAINSLTRSSIEEIKSTAKDAMSKPVAPVNDPIYLFVVDGPSRSKAVQINTELGTSDWKVQLVEDLSLSQPKAAREYDRISVPIARYFYANENDVERGKAQLAKLTNDLTQICSKAIKLFAKPIRTEEAMISRQVRLIFPRAYFAKGACPAYASIESVPVDLTPKLPELSSNAVSAIPNR